MHQDPIASARPAPARSRWFAVAATLAGLVLVVALGKSLLTPAGAPPTAHVAAGPTATAATAAPLVGHYAPDATLLDLTNARVPLSNYRGKVVVLNFWYVACEPCRYEMPALEQAYETGSAKGLVVVGVDITDDAQTISDFVQQLGITYPVVRDYGRRTLTAYQITRTPSSFIIDREGVIRYSAAGPLASATLTSQVAHLLAQP